MAITLNGTTGITTPALDNQGNLTVDTNTLFVDSVNNRVGVGTANPTEEIHGYSSGGDFSLKLESASATGTAYTYYKNADRQWATGIRGSVGDSYQIIDSNADTARLVIDSAGRVTMPYQPSFVAGFTGGGYVTVPDGNVIPFNYTGGSGAFDNGANFNTGTSRFTAPVTGRYFIQANGSAVSGGTRSIQIMKNGSALNNGADTMASFVTLAGATVTAVMSLIVYLAAGDYVDARTRNGSIDIYKNHSWFLGYLIG